MGRPYSQEYQRFEQDLFDANGIRRMDEEHAKVKGVHGFASADKIKMLLARQMSSGTILELHG